MSNREYLSAKDNDENCFHYQGTAGVEITGHYESSVKSCNLSHLIWADVSLSQKFIIIIYKETTSSFIFICRLLMLLRTNVLWLFQKIVGFYNTRIMIS